MAPYVPAKGDLVALSFEPQSGHEQRGRRPALVISNDLFNQSTGLAIVCPITRAHRNVPFHVALPKETTTVTGFVMVEQVKTVDFRARRVRYIDKMPDPTLYKVLGILDTCIY